MNADVPSATGSTPLEAQLRVDKACGDFEAAWQAGQRPRIEDYLAGVAETDRLPLLRELVKLEIDLRRQAGEQPLYAEYAARFPDHLEVVQVVLSQELRQQPAAQRAVDSMDGSTGPAAPDSASSASEQQPPPPAESPTALPLQIARFKVARRLGGGTFGDVYLASDELMGRQVAIKVPSRRLVASHSARDAFLSEARSVAELKHEGIVRAYEFGQEPDGTCYIVYDFIEGTNLKERIKPERLAKEPMTPDLAARLVAQVAEALHYAHLQRLVHRDIKPANILLDQNGRPLITDFGLAVRDEDLPKERGRLAGTLSYMSPEQVRRRGHHIDGRSDIYSLGVILYELLCGRRPFVGETEDELEDQILHREAKPPRQIKDSIPRELEAVCLKALSKRVQDRYTTARDMAEEVIRAVESSKKRKPDEDAAITLEEVERRMASAGEDELRRLLRLLQDDGNPACVPAVFRCLSHSSEAVRQQARKTTHSLGWNKVSDAAEALARRDDAAGIAAVLGGLAAFEAHPQVVGLLDRLVVLLKGDLRNRTILLLERKRLGLELDGVAGLFRDIHSPYRIEKVLGQGLFAAAYMAHVDGADLAVVVRVLRPEFVAQPQLRANFLDLSKRALQLVHENLVLTREARAFPERNIYFTVRDYVNGATLQKVLEGGKRFEPPQVVGILRQLLAALGAVHRRGMVHGGVKPSNIFVCEEDRVVLGDPALAVPALGVGLERLSYDYRYVAPETFRGSQTPIPQSDLYSLGCVAHELACGEPPFVDDNYLELAARHMRDTVVTPSHRGSMLGPAGDELLLKLLARSSGDRHGRAEDVLQALDRLETSWRRPGPALRPTPAPLLRDASLARLQAAESMLGFDASGASLMPGPEPTQPPGPALPQQVPEPPNQIGRYEILEELGRGGMGVVYRAVDRQLARHVALKVLPSGLVDEAQRTRFLTEARAVAQLAHPHIMQIYDIGEHDGVPYLALEYVRGGSLAGKQGREPMPPRDAAELVAKLARAVDHAHQHGVLHRDLKPSNVLLTADGDPKIADFGLAKMLEPTNTDPSLTQSGVILGTPRYMAPEQAAGNVKELGPAADIYSLGAMFYELLTGQPPFRGASAFETFSQLATAKVIPPHVLNAAVNLDLSTICLKCLEKDSQKRYTSAMELAEDLERWLRGGPILARPVSKLGRLARLCLRSLAGLFTFRNRRGKGGRS
jgi:serine/threonine protein kinase